MKSRAGEPGLLAEMTIRARCGVTGKRQLRAARKKKAEAFLAPAQQVRGDGQGGVN